MGVQVETLIYLRARYYDPATGQFISRDPALGMTREPYAYTYDNPLNLTDPSGLFGALPKLADLASKFGTDEDTVAGTTIYNGQRYVDTANGGNINCVFQCAQNGLTRVTLDPSGSRIISAGLMQMRNLMNGIESGRFQ